LIYYTINLKNNYKSLIIQLIMNLNTIFLIGPQGSGKGTQARLLAKRLNFFYWEMGGILREVAKEDSELGKEVKKLVDNGILLEDELLLKVVESRLSHIDKNQGVIFDGIPRRLGQAEFLLNFLKNQGRKKFITLFLDIPKETTFKRLLLRAEKEGRADDTKEKIQVRLNQYYKDTLPVLNYLKKETNFFQVDGSFTIEEVDQNVNKILGINEK